MNTPAQCGAIKPPKTDIYSEAPHVAQPNRLPEAKPGLPRQDTVKLTSQDTNPTGTTTAPPTDFPRRARSDQ